jgi:hypothetical protein
MMDPDEMIIRGTADIKRFDELIEKKREFFKKTDLQCRLHIDRQK